VDGRPATIDEVETIKAYLPKRDGELPVVISVTAEYIISINGKPIVVAEPAEVNA
jgi:hypothetical protein